MDYYLSYLMGADNISDEDLTSLNVEIIETTSSGSRKLKIPSESVRKYVELVKGKLNAGFWNEIVGNSEIIFTFKYKDGTCKQYVLNVDTETEISELCAEFNNEPSGKTLNMYKYISENDFYRDLMMKYYSELINR